LGIQKKCSVLITGGAMAPEAEALVAANGWDAHYVDFYTSSEELAALAAEHRIDALLVRSGRIDHRVIEASPHLRVIAKHGSGVDNIDLHAATRLGIPVLRAIAANARAVAEHAFALMAAMVKDVRRLDLEVRGGSWPKANFRGNDLQGAVLGLIGFGEIGRCLAGMARAFDMTILVHDPVAARCETVTWVDDLDELIRRSDIVSLHCPLNDATRHMMDARRFALMQPSAFLINTARGGLVDEQALIHALETRRIAGAGLDSFEAEPPSADNRLWSLPNLLATPHIGGASRAAHRRMGVGAVNNILDVLSGRPPEVRCLANPDVMTQAPIAGRHAAS
jgi:D-3-phosphoglycerate dehydrogenase / 2-oxoglutarate reductase